MACPCSTGGYALRGFRPPRKARSSDVGKARGAWKENAKTTTASAGTRLDPGSGRRGSSGDRVERCGQRAALLLLYP